MAMPLGNNLKQNKTNKDKLSKCFTLLLVPGCGLHVQLQRIMEGQGDGTVVSYKYLKYTTLQLIQSNSFYSL